MSHEINIDRATFEHNMRGGRGYMTGNPSLDAHGPFRKRPPEPKRVIGSWEADAYVEMEIDKLGQDANRHGFTVGRTAGSRRALEGLRKDLSEAIHRRYTVIKD